MKKDIPAFPCEYDTFATLKDGTTLNIPVKASSAGMTLRDYFAASASEDDIHIHREQYEEMDQYKMPIYKYKYTREQARYRYADAMLAAREVKHEHD